MVLGFRDVLLCLPVTPIERRVTTPEEWETLEHGTDILVPDYYLITKEKEFWFTAIGLSTPFSNTFISTDAIVL